VGKKGGYLYGGGGSFRYRLGVGEKISRRERTKTKDAWAETERLIKDKITQGKTRGDHLGGRSPGGWGTNPIKGI